jgi:hypothetical protein
MGDSGVRADIERVVNSVLLKVEISAMHDAFVALVFMAILMFPCFVAMELPK